MAEKVKKEDPRLAAARKRASALAKATGGGGRNRQNLMTFLTEVGQELKKTTWPDRETLVKSTTVVLAFIAATGVWVFLLNFILTRLTARLFGM